jgi:uncharacterized alkaline shock family protein YloU
MSVFNRLFIILLALVLLVAAIAVLLTTLHVAQPSQAAPAGSWFVDRLTPFAQLDSSLSGWAIGVCVAFVVVAVVLLFLELRVRSRARHRVTIKEDDLGRVTLALDGVRELADHEASRVVGVNRAHSQVQEEQEGLHILCRVSVDPTSNVPEMTAELRERLKSAVEHHVGLPVTEVSVEAQVAPLVSNQHPRRRVE